MKRIDYTNKDLEEFIKLTAIQLQIPVDVVEKVIKDQWKSANKAAASLKEIEVKEIGIFYPSSSKIFSRLTYYNKVLARNKCQTVIDEVTAKVREIEKTKYYDRVKGRLEQQVSNTGGDNQQHIPQEGS